jgi:hypothetical protein
VDRCVAEVIVSRKHLQIMGHAELRQDGVDRSDLDAAPSQRASQLSRPDVIIATWRNERQGGKALDYLLAIARAGEALQQLLQDQPGAYDSLT